MKISTSKNLPTDHKQAWLSMKLDLSALDPNQRVALYEQFAKLLNVLLDPGALAELTAQLQQKLDKLKASSPKRAKR